MKYKFSVDTELADKVSMAVDTLNRQQLEEVWKLIREVKEEEKRRILNMEREMFLNCALPVLKRFAETNECDLNLQEQEEEFIVIIRGYSWYINEAMEMEKYVMFAAHHIAIETQGKEVLLTLIYPRNKG